MGSSNRFDIEVGAITTDLKKGLADARAELNKFKKETESTDWKSVLNAEKVALAQSRTEAQNYRTEVAKLILEKRKGQTQTEALSGSYREAQQRLTALGKSIREAQGGFTNTSPLIRQQINEYNQLNTKLKEFDSTMGNNYRNVGNYESAFAGSLPIIGQYASVLGGVTLAMEGVQKSLSTNLKLDSLKTALKVVSGDTQTFESNLSFLRNTSDRLGLDFVTLAEGFKTWQGAAKFSNLTLDESKRIFESVANAGAKMKLSNDEIRGSLLALSQMMSKGNVQAEELRGQLSERLPGAFALSAKAMGVTEKELNKMLENGEVLASDLLPKLATELDNAFGNDKTKNVESLQSSVNRLGNEFDRLWESERATNFFSYITDGLADVTRGFNDLISSNGFIEGSARLLSFFGGGNASDFGRTLNQIADFNKPFSNNLTRNNNYVENSPFNWAGQNQKFGFPLRQDYKFDSKRYEDAQQGIKKVTDEVVKETEANKKLREAKEKAYDRNKLAIYLSSLNEYDRKIEEILIKYKEQVKLSAGDATLLGLAKDNKDAEILKVRVQELIDSTKKLKALTGKTSGITLSGSMAELPTSAGLINSSAGQLASNRMSSTTDNSKLENRLARTIENGLRKGIEDIVTDIDNLGSNFYEVFSNVFGKLSSNFTSLMSGVISTSLSDGLSKKFSSGEFEIGGLSNNLSKALVAGATLGGKILGGLISQSSAVGQAGAGLLSGAGAGGGIGALFSKSGGIWGAAIGGVIGAISGIFGSSKAKKQEELQRQQLEEQKKQTALMERQQLLSYSSSVIGQMTNAGIVQSVDRDVFGNLVTTIKGSTLEILLQRAKSERGS